MTDDRFLLLLNGHHEPVPFTLPPARWGSAWQVELDTTASEVSDEGLPQYKAGDAVELAGRSVVLLRAVADE